MVLWTLLGKYQRPGEGSAWECSRRAPCHAAGVADLSLNPRRVCKSRQPGRKRGQPGLWTASLDAGGVFFPNGCSTRETLDNPGDFHWYNSPSPSNPRGWICGLIGGAERDERNVFSYRNRDTSKRAFSPLFKNFLDWRTLYNWICTYTVSPPFF